MVLGGRVCYRRHTHWKILGYFKWLSLHAYEAVFALVDLNLLAFFHFR